MTPIIAVFGSSGIHPGEAAYEEGILVGRLLAEKGFAVSTGGYAGLMEAVSKGAAQAGGRVLGYSAPGVFPHRTGVNPWVTEEKTAETIAQRIHLLVDEADGFIALPGSIGTLAELMVAWNAAFVAPFADEAPRPVVAVGETWRNLIDGLISTLNTPSGLVECVPSGEDAVAVVARAIPRSC